MRIFRLFVFLSFFISCLQISAQPKREFRGAWIQCVNGQFNGLGRDRMQQTLSYQLDELRKDGVNAIIFQVRAECDALYPSKLEPWSRFLTGQQGRAPQPYWDPLQWMVEQCHKRGMEIHAWINPYRAKTKTTTELASNHIAIQHPNRVFSYGGQFIMNPALQENRDYICQVVTDILQRYDVDGLHIDDYFYPYPVAGEQIPDEADFRRQSDGKLSLADWRRHNVDLLIEQLHETIRRVKPWVKFGVSPFGIYHNKKNGNQVPGSATGGLQNYDDLYADVLKWVREGWVDYNVPQLYWQIGHPTADYATLIKWWNDNCNGRPLYIGEDVERTAKYADPHNPRQNQMPAKHALHQQNQNVQGTVLWYAKAVVDNVGSYGSVLRNYYWTRPALQPLMPFIDSKAPGKPRKVKVLDVDGDRVLFWTAPKGTKWNDEAREYVVYRFDKGERIDLEDASKIQTVTRDTFYKLPTAGIYVVTALDRMSNESKGVKKKVK